MTEISRAGWRREMWGLNWSPDWCMALRTRLSPLLRLQCLKRPRTLYRDAQGLLAARLNRIGHGIVGQIPGVGVPYQRNSLVLS